MLRRSNALSSLELSCSERLKLHLSFIAYRPKAENILFCITEARFTEYSDMHTCFFYKKTTILPEPQFFLTFPEIEHEIFLNFS